MTLDEIKDDIIGACEEFKARGYTLATKFKVIGEGGVVCGGCALTAVAVVRAGIPIDAQIAGVQGSILRAVSDRYGHSFTRIAFVDGFDGAPSAWKGVPEYELGREVRSVVLP